MHCIFVLGATSDLLGSVCSLLRVRLRARVTSYARAAECSTARVLCHVVARKQNLCQKINVVMPTTPTLSRFKALFPFALRLPFSAAGRWLLCLFCDLRDKEAVFEYVQYPMLSVAFLCSRSRTVCSIVYIPDRVDVDVDLDWTLLKRISSPRL